MRPAVEALLARGVKCLTRLDVAGAEAAFHEAVARSNRDPLVKRRAADAYRRPGWYAFNLPGHLEEAWRIFQNARALYESLGAGCEYEAAKSCRGLSITAGKLGDRETALHYGEAAEAHLAGACVTERERGELLAKLRNDRVIACRQLGRWDEAEQLVRANLDWIASRDGKVDALLAANAYNNLGSVFLDAGRTREAARAFAAARERLVDLGARVRVARCDLRLAEAHLARGTLDAAAKALDRAEAGFRRERAPSLRAADLRGRLLLKRGDPTGARRCFARAIRLAERERAELDVEDFRMTFQGTVQDVYRRAFRLELGRPAHAFALAERARARAFLDVVEAGERRVFPGLRPGERARLEGKRAGIAELAARSDPALAQAQSAYLMLARRYEMAVRARRGLPQVEPLAAGAIRRRLAPDEAVVEYFADGEAMHVFVARRRKLVLRTLRVGLTRLEAEAAALPAVVRASRRELRHGGGQTLFEWTMRELHGLLWAPIAKDVAGAARIVLVPGATLYGVPFAALIDSRGPLVERHEFRRAPSASVAMTLRAGRRAPPPTGKARCLLVKDPTGTLPQAEEEERVLRTAFGSRLTVLAGDRATPEAFARLAPRNEVLHVATHAVYAAERPEFSYFELAAAAAAHSVGCASGARASEAEGTSRMARFHAVDVSGLDLRRCRLVVLSACETARSHGMGADEMLGLPRAFLRAGAASVVATLWPIAEHAGLSRLMTGLYAGGGVRENAPAALRVAQREAAARGGPYDVWAGWVGMG